MKLRELIHLQLNTENPTRQQRLVRLLIAFIAVMLVLTLVSRAADSLTVALVEAEQPKSGAIEHRVSAQGVLSANREAAALALDSVLVESVEVYEGAAVKTGDLLFTLNMDDLRRQLTDKQIERQKLQLQLQDLYLQQAFDEEISQRAQSRADEDYDAGLLRADEQVKRAAEDKSDAADDLSKFRRHNDWVEDYEDFEDEDDDDFDFTIGDSYSSSKEELEALRRAYEEKRRAYEDAKLDRQDALRRAERAIEDAETVDPADTQMKRLALDVQKTDIEIEDIQQAIAAEGKIVSPVDGVVTELSVSTGKRTSAEASAILAQTSEGYRFKATLDEEQAKYVARGDKVTITLAGKQRGTEAAIESIVPSREVPGGVDVVSMVAEGEIGQSATMEAARRSESYPVCVPIGAVRGAEPDQFVLVVDERESVLGKEKVALKVPVTVREMNDNRAAVEGALQSSQKVIIKSSKSIYEGDRVRLTEAQG